MSESRCNELLITDLPDDIIKKIMLNLSYDEIAQKRIVCKKFNSISKEILNEEYKLLKSHIEKYIIDVQSTLPHSESARSANLRCRHSGVLNILKLNMNCLIKSYDVYLKEDLGCFIAGKVIDEAIKILNLIKDVEILAEPPYKITKEFREMTNVAQRHFKEVVEPYLKNILNDRSAKDSKNSLLEIQSNDDSTQTSFLTEKYEQSQKFSKFHYRMRKNKIFVLCIKGQIGQIKSRLRKQTQKIHELNKRVACIEQKINCPNGEVHQEKESNLERKIDYLTSLLASIAVNNVKL